MLLAFGPLVRATLVGRRKRFFADVALADGSPLTAHCPNTGAMTGLLHPGAPVLLSVSANPKRQLPHTLEAIADGGTWVGVNTQNPNRLALLLARAGLPPFAPGDSVRPEVRYGRAERVDLLLEGPAGRHYVEVKNVHLVERPGEASFPDCVTARGTKHLHALADVVRGGDSATMLFLIQRGDVGSFRLARHVDPAYGAAFDLAASAGVRMVALRCEVSEAGVRAAGTVPVVDLLPIAAAGDLSAAAPSPT